MVSLSIGPASLASQHSTQHEDYLCLSHQALPMTLC